jgi:hypothetical protein
MVRNAARRWKVRFDTTIVKAFLRTGQGEESRWYLAAYREFL